MDECGWSSAVLGDAKQAEYLTQMFANWKQNAERLNINTGLWYILNDWQFADGAGTTVAVSGPTAPPSLPSPPFKRFHKQTKGALVAYSKSIAAIVAAGATVLLTFNIDISEELQGAIITVATAVAVWLAPRNESV